MSSFREAVYGRIDPPSPSHDSGVQVSPTTPSHYGYPTRKRYYIFPPNINGHGRLVPARRTVPHAVGCVLVVAVFAWAVCSALFAYTLLGGHDWRPGPGHHG
ncbi:uncharacterized protein SETTUDRAFT_161858 [Exserohilum turcica Et28A]|uniref:Uncharacterized protein n=1 Tax=Exserohilum turcicum (strain 28A) TaxID=671987 RepID=R0ILK4_EXST2|nr:uncharacterized protein SETTUDRAFT_161858 [Exserohilum turcica Et28A]EOA85676.1 hypothetical protein SETTUDRAFT_161858 [Exserohilum turcica Et28A]